MYLMYVDESGDPGVGQHCSPHLSENKKPRFNNQGFFATPTEQAVLPRPTYIFNNVFCICLTVQRYNLK